MVIRIYVVGVDVERMRMLESHHGGVEVSGREGRCKGESEADKDCGDSYLFFLDTSSLAWYTIKNESSNQCYVRMACRMIQVDRRLAQRARAFVWILA